MYIIYILICICIIMYMGVVQNYGTPKLPLRRPFANLSRPFAPQQNRDMEYSNVFVCIFRTKDLQ